MGSVQFRGVLCVLVGLGLAGCDQLFHLDEVGPQAPDAAHLGRVIDDPTGDLDGDMVPNAMDLCPTINQQEVPNAGTDADMDGVGDACDPHPTNPGDCLALFDDFQNQATPASAWKWTGDPMEIVDGKSLALPASPNYDDAYLYLDQSLDLDAIYVWAYVQAGDNPGSGQRHAAQAFFNLQVSPSINGTGCGVESSGSGSQVTTSTITGGVEGVVIGMPIGSNLVGIPNDVVITWGMTPGQCKGEVGPNNGHQSTVIALDPPPSGAFGLHLYDAGLHVYAIAGWGHACK